MCTKSAQPEPMAAAYALRAPSTFTRHSCSDSPAPGSTIAARWTTTSAPAIASCSASMSSTLPITSCTPAGGSSVGLASKLRITLPGCRWLNAVRRWLAEEPGAAGDTIVDERALADALPPKLTTACLNQPFCAGSAAYAQ